ncbi:MAG: hypothetical protein ABJG33_15725 [Balneola sp.]
MGSAVLIVVIGIIRLNNVPESMHLNPKETEILPAKVNGDNLNFEFNKKDSLIYSVAVLNTKVCPSCVSNTLEFIREAQKRKEFNENFKIIFINEPKKDVDRFVQLTDMDYPVLLMELEDIDPFFYDKKQTFIFLNSSSEVFYYFTIPVSHSSLNKINYEIKNIIELRRLNS